MTYLLVLHFFILVVPLLSVAMEPPRKHSRLFQIGACKLVAIPSANVGVKIPRTAKPCFNENIIGVKTSDRFQIMVLKKFVDESVMLRQMTRRVRTSTGAGLIVRTDITKQEFNNMLDYLKKTAEITALEKKLEEADNVFMRDFFSCQLRSEIAKMYDDLARCVNAECAHVSPQEVCDHAYERNTFWRHLLKMATRYRMNTLRRVLLLIGRDRDLVGAPSTPEIITLKRAALYGSTQ